MPVLRAAVRGWSNILGVRLLAAAKRLSLFERDAVVSSMMSCIARVALEFLLALSTPLMNRGLMVALLNVVTVVPLCWVVSLLEAKRSS